MLRAITRGGAAMMFFSFRTLAFAWTGLAGAAAVSAAVLQASYVPAANTGSGGASRRRRTIGAGHRSPSRAVRKPLSTGHAAARRTHGRRASPNDSPFRRSRRCVLQGWNRAEPCRAAATPPSRFMRPSRPIPPGGGGCRIQASMPWAATTIMAHSPAIMDGNQSTKGQPLAAWRWRGLRPLVPSA